METQTPALRFFDRPLAVALALVISSTAVYRIIHRRKTRLPPGPSGWPIIGNALVLIGAPWLKFTEWMHEYGPLVHVNAAGTAIIVLNDRRVAHDLLDLRAADTSNRAQIIVGDLMTGGLMLSFLGRGPLYRKFHTAIVKWTRVGDSFSYRLRPAVYRRSLAFCKHLLDDPEHWDKYCKHAAISTGLSVVYGTIPGNDSEEEAATIDAAEDFVSRLSNAARPGTFVVDIVPWLQYLPSFLTPWKTYAANSFAKDSAMFNKWLNVTRGEIGRGSNDESICRSLIENPDLSELEATWLSAAFVTGSMTTMGVLGWFMLAMVLYPEVQHRAQVELDRVVGRDRLPNFEDYKYMPYIQAMVREIIRWRPVDPIGLPHSNNKDIAYGDYIIPKDSVLLFNVWGMNRDPEVWGSDAHDFNPERHLDPATGQLKTVTGSTREHHASFGFGRRVCPGRHVAVDIVYIFSSMVLWSMKLSHATDATGNAIPIDVDGFIDDGLIIRPVPFACSIVPRSKDATSLLESTQELPQR